jgi:hypothetical protein
MHTYTYSEILDYSFAVITIASILFLVSCFPIESKNTDGVVAIFTGVVFVLFLPVSYYALRIAPSRMGIGTVIGASLVMITVALQTAIFWGQHGNCLRYSVAPEGQQLKDEQEPELMSHRLLQEADVVNKTDYMISYKQFTETTCNSTEAMKRLCGIAVFIFLFYIYFVGVVYHYMDDIVGSSSEYCLVSTSAVDEVETVSGTQGGMELTSQTIL